jgi:hypothetical protein
VALADSAGIEIVTNDSATSPLALAETVRIGVVEGEPAYQFHDIADLDVGRDGTLVVFDEGSHSLRLFDGAGRFIRAIGRQGEGPGEFRGGRTAQYSVGLWGDTVVLAESSRGVRFSVFDTAGVLVHTARGPDSPYFFRDASVILDSGVLRVTVSHLPDVGWDEAGEVATTLTVHEIDLASARVGPELTGVPGRLVSSLGDGTDFPRAIPYFEPSPLAALVPGGILTTPAVDYEIRVLGPDGTPRRIVRRRYEPTPLAGDFRDQLERALPPSPMTDLMLARSPRVATLPPIDRLAATREGGFWVRRKDRTSDPLDDIRRAFLSFDGTDPSPAIWEGFDPDGVYLGTVTLPEGFTPHAWGPDWVAGVTEDELDVEYVVRMAIREADDT